MWAGRWRKLKNFHRDKRLVAYCADIWRNHDLSVEAAVARILAVVDVLSLVRVTEGRLPISRSQLLRHTGLSSEEFARLIDPMLPISQQELKSPLPVSYGLLTRQLSKSGGRGRPSEYYSIINRGRRGTTKPKITWDGEVVDAGYRESLQWDIAVEIWHKPWVREVDIVRLFKGYPTINGEGTYEVVGVRAHIEEMLVWNRLRRATEVEAHKLLGGAKAHGSIPAVLVKGDVPLNPDGRKRARRWSVAEHLRTLAARAIDGPLDTETARNAPAQPGFENVPGEEAVPEPDVMTPQRAETPSPASAKPKPVPEVVQAEPLVLDENGWPVDEGVPEGEADEAESTMRSAKARNRVP
jgi:hypothetical protein